MFRSSLLCGSKAQKSPSVGDDKRGKSCKPKRIPSCLRNVVTRKSTTPKLTQSEVESLQFQHSSVADTTVMDSENSVIFGDQFSHSQFAKLPIYPSCPVSASPRAAAAGQKSPKKHWLKKKPSKKDLMIQQLTATVHRQEETIQHYLAVSNNNLPTFDRHSEVSSDRSSDPESEDTGISSCCFDETLKFENDDLRREVSNLSMQLGRLKKERRSIRTQNSLQIELLKVQLQTLTHELESKNFELAASEKRNVKNVELMIELEEKLFPGCVTEKAEDLMEDARMVKLVASRIHSSVLNERSVHAERSQALIHAQKAICNIQKELTQQKLKTGFHQREKRNMIDSFNEMLSETRNETMCLLAEFN